MKKKLLASVVAGLGLVGSAHAVHVNPDGLGQVLLYPYYSVQGGNDTYVHVVNTTDSAKAVKVRFLEGKNSQEVLDFNLYLSPKDEWTGVITRTETGAQISSQDTSCIAPRQLTTPVAFRDFKYENDSVNGAGRTREGYLEIIEMGDLPTDVNVSGKDYSIADAATHVDGEPLDCAGVRTWGKNSVSISASGGLYGFNTLINVEGGMSTTIDAVALDDFWLEGQGGHTPPENESPSLDSVYPTADILDGTLVVNASYDFGIDAVSAVLARTNVMNDYVVGLDFDALTDWVVTFPTKRFYVQEAFGEDDELTATRALFSERWDRTTSRSCDEIGIEYFDREERKEQGDDDFSPTPPDAKAALCNEVNTISIVEAGGQGGLLGAEFTDAQIELASGFNAGWMEINLAPADTKAAAGLTSEEGVVVRGLPVIGFAFTSFTNGTLEVDGVNVLSNYGGSTSHKGERSITTP